MKTNAARILDQLNIPYQILTYEIDSQDLGAESVAQKVGLPPNQVFKTLVLEGDCTGIYLAVLPGNAQLNRKAFAKLTGNRKIEAVPQKNLHSLTGYIRGGVTALCGKKNYPVYVDATAKAFAQIAVSGGKRGVLLLLNPDDYLTAINGVLASIT